MAEGVEQQQQNVVERLTNLPLVSSTCDMVSSAYVNTKDNYPYLKSVCEVTGKSMKTITSVAMTSANPILQQLEPEIAMANNIACVGLDKIEDRLPILYQPSEKVVANALEAVVGAKGVVDKMKGAMQDSVQMTKSANGSITTVLGSSVMKIMSTGVDTALTTSETLLEQYLPPTDEEMAKEATKTEGLELSKDKPSHYARLESFSKACKGAYQQALTRIKDVKSRSQEAIAQLQNTVGLVPTISINDVASETDGNLEVLEEEALRDLSQINGRVVKRE